MNPSTPRVAIARSEGDYDAVVPRLLSLAGAEQIVAPGESVLIKPNLHAEQHWTTGGTTNPALVQSLVRWAKERGASDVVVADGPYYGLQQPERVFTTTGMAHAVEQAGARWAAIPRHEFRLFRNASTWLPDEVGLSEFLFRLDRVINVALLKTHLDCVVSLGMKNLKGCLRDTDKAAFHARANIHRAIVALNRLVQPDLTIVDGTLGMEGLGPAQGTVADFKYMFASRHTPSVDLVAARAMGFGTRDVPMLRVAQEVGLLEPGNVRTVGEALGRIRRRFERPDEALARQLPGLDLRTRGACSACRLNVLRALRLNEDQGIPPPQRPVAIGHVPKPPEHAILIGACARDRAGHCPHLAGCPPEVKAIQQFLARGHTP